MKLSSYIHFYIVFLFLQPKNIALKMFKKEMDFERQDSLGGVRLSFLLLKIGFYGIMITA